MATRRSPSTPVVVLGCALVAALLVVVGFFVLGVGGVGGEDGDETPTGTGAGVVSSDEFLSIGSRLGYAGLGPITLGMSEAEAERAGQMTIEPSDGGCSYRVMPAVAASGLAPGDVSVWFERGLGAITVGNPAIQTISGIHVGSTADDVFRTYSNAIETTDGGSSAFITITSADGRFINFYVNPERIVTAMILSRNQDVLEGWTRC